MARAIEVIVEGYAKLGDRLALENLREHRRHLAVDLKAKTGFDYRSTIAEVEQDIVAIEAGLQILTGQVAKSSF